jgi:hypothetical protein
MLKKMPLALTLALAVNAGAQAAPLFNGNAALASAGAGMKLLYEINIPGINPAYRDGTPVPYTVNNLASILTAYSRVGYYVEVTTGPQAGQYVYVSMDTFDANPASLGLPHNYNNPIARQTVVNNASIFSNNASIVTGTGVGTVNLEMWSTNYATGGTGAIPGGNDGSFDFNDSGWGIGAGHGSFQIHNFGAGQTLFGWSDWGGNSPWQNSEFGIGNASELGYFHNDWTFSDLGQTGMMQIVVGDPVVVPEPATLGMLGLGLAALAFARRRKDKQA